MEAFVKASSKKFSFFSDFGFSNFIFVHLSSYDTNTGCVVRWEYTKNTTPATPRKKYFFEEHTHKRTHASRLLPLIRETRRPTAANWQSTRYTTLGMPAQVAQADSLLDGQGPSPLQQQQEQQEQHQKNQQQEHQEEHQQQQEEEEGDDEEQVLQHHQDQRQGNDDTETQQKQQDGDSMTSSTLLEEADAHASDSKQGFGQGESTGRAGTPRVG